MATREVSNGTRITDRWTNVAPAGYYSGSPLTLQRALTAAEAADLAATDAANVQATNRTTITNAATNAIAANVTFLAIASPTTAQVTTQVKALTRQVDALIKLTLGLLDDTSGT